jgi:serine protease Do
MKRRLLPRHARGLSLALFAAVLLAGSLAHAGARRITTSSGTGTVVLAELEDQFAALADRVAPSVVAISAACDPTDTDDAVRSDELTTEKLDRFLSHSTRTVGTGFVLDADGYIVTNEHVVGDAVQIWVTTDSRKVYPAIVVGSDPRSDLAVLKIPATGLMPVHFAPHGTVRRGQWAIALGNPFGLAGEGDLAMSVGIVSATDRSLPKLSTKENRVYSNLIQTTAEINPGNSGGPLFDLDGQVLGINTAVILPQKASNGIGFAIPVTPHVLELLELLRQGREVTYAYLGVTVSTPSTRDRRDAGIEAEIGARVDAIEPDSPASADSLIHPGDLLVCLNRATIRDSDDFVRRISQAAVDEPAILRLHRDGKPLTVTVTPRRRPMPSVAVNRQNQRVRWRGLVLTSLPPHWSGDPSARPTGLMVLSIDDDSPLARTVSMGSIITSVAGHAVASIAELQSVIDRTPPEQWQIETASAPAAMAAGH